MRLQHIEVEATSGYSQPVPESAVLQHAPVEQEGITQQKNIAALTHGTTARLDPREAFLVSLWSLFLILPANWLGKFLAATAYGISWQFPLPHGAIMGTVSFLVTLFCVAVFGIGVGLRANRRTMVASIAVAKVVGLLLSFLIIAYAFKTSSPQVWAMTHVSLVDIVFSAVTVAFTEIAVALYIQRKFRRIAGGL